MFKNCVAFTIMHLDKIDKVFENLIILALRPSLLTLEIPGGSIDPFLTLKSDKNETSYYFRSKIL